MAGIVNTTWTEFRFVGLMHTHALTTALTLYRSGTVTLTQAARSAGCTEPEMAATLREHGISVREVLSGPRPSTGAD